MIEEYRGIEINTLVKLKQEDKEKSIVPIVLNRQNINYYRVWADPDAIKTVIYFKETARGLVIECGYDYLRLQLAKSKLVDKLELEKLSFEQLEKLESFISQLRLEY